MVGEGKQQEAPPDGTCRADDWHPARIKYELELRGYSLAKLSRQQGYSPTAAGRALRVAWPSMEAVIAEVIGVPPEDIWPSRYDERGVPLSYKPRRRKPSASKEDFQPGASSNHASSPENEGDSTS